MKKTKFLLSILLCLCLKTFAQNQQTFYYKKDGRRVNTKDSADFTCIVQEQNPNSGLFPLKEYYKNGNLKATGSYSTDAKSSLKFEGTFREFYINGTRKRVSTYNRGKKAGREYNYYPNGQLYTYLLYPDSVSELDSRAYSVIEVNDATGKPLVTDGNGQCEFYDEDLLLITDRGMIRNGRQDGLWTGRDPQLRFSYKETYAQGKLVSGESIDSTNTKIPYTRIEAVPGYRGGLDAFYKYLTRNLRYPKNCRRAGILGVAIVKFIVDKDGSVKEAKVVNDIHAELAAEAERVVKESPLWSPGLLRGIPVRVVYNVPITFALK